MRNKRLYLLTIFYIVVFVFVFRWVYPEAQYTNLITVTALLGFIVALGSDFLIKRIKQNQGKDDEK